MLAILKNFAVALWKSLNFVRRAFANLIAIVVLGVLLGVWLIDSTPSVPEHSVLEINLSGNIVEQGSISSDTLASLLSGSEPETRLRDVTLALDLAAKDKRIDSVMMRLDDLQGAGLATLREIGVAMDRFKQSGKRITVWSTSYSQKQYAIASHASAVYVHPMGQVLLKGLASQRLYWGDALKKLGVTVHVFKAGAYKSAPESFVLNAPSKAALQADRFWMTDAWRQFTDSIESARGLMPGAVDKMIAELPDRLEKAQGDMSRVALDENLIDGVLSGDEARNRVLEQGSGKGKARLETIDYLTYLATNAQAPAANKSVAVLVIEGEIKDGVDGPGMTGERDVIARIQAAKEDDTVGALVVRINSPGGSAVASELIRRELELVRKSGKPVVASFGDYAASGGYWVALAADKIVTDPQSITGSIGVFGMVPTFEKTLSNLSIGTGGVSTSWLADAESPMTPLSDDYERIMQLSIARTYREFVALVSQSRKMEEKQVMQIAQGRVYTGRQALERGLADELGGLDEAVQEAAKLSGASAEDVLWFEPEQGRLGLLLERFMTKAAEKTGLREALAPYTQLLKSASIREAGRITQLVSSPTMPYAHCLCSAP